MSPSDNCKTQEASEKSTGVTFSMTKSSNKYEILVIEGWERVGKMLKEMFRE